MSRLLDANSPGFRPALEALLATGRDAGQGITDAVTAIIASVREAGDTALIGHTARLDGLALQPGGLEISPAERRAGAARCARPVIAALEKAAARITAYHRRQMPRDLSFTDDAGVTLGWRWTALDSVGLYVPGGSASYPSSVLMNAIPARVAGVQRLTMAVPTPDGVIGEAVLAAAEIAGIDRVYRIGGAQAVAALAFGTETVAAVDKIVGPGNAWVAEAKRQVFGHVGIDTIAGPSEILIVSDGAADAAWLAADLLAQAEHDPAARAILLTDDADHGRAVLAAVDAQLPGLARSDIAAASWADHGAVIVVASLQQAADIANRIAPEHLQLAVRDPDALAPLIRHAGALFLGIHAPEALGDYIAGPSHVLPTAGSARFASGLSVLDFLKRSSLISGSAPALAALAPDAMSLARAEGLGGHAAALSIRLNRNDDSG